MKIVIKMSVNLILFCCMQTAIASTKYDYAIPAIHEAASKGMVGHWSVGEPKYQSDVVDHVKYVVTDISQISSYNEMFLSIETSSGDYIPVARVELGNAQNPLIGIHKGVVSIKTGYGHHGTYSTEYVFEFNGDKFHLSKIRDFADYDNYYDVPSIQTISLLLVDFDAREAEFWLKQFKFDKSSGPGSPGFDTWSHALSIYRMTLALPFPSCAVIKLGESDFLLDGLDLDKFEQWMGEHVWKRAVCPSTGTTPN